MALDDIRDSMDDKDNADRNRWIGVYIGVLAVLLAICGVGGGNAAKDASRANLDSANMWAFFQAKNMRRTSYQLAADDLELMLAGQPQMPPEARAAIEKKIAAYRETIKLYTSDPKRNEGLDELFVRAKALEKDRDISFRKDPYFDWSQALLQIAIVLASVSIISGSAWLLSLSGGIAALGILLMLNGFTLAVAVPFLS